MALPHCAELVNCRKRGLENAAPAGYHVERFINTLKSLKKPAFVKSADLSKIVQQEPTAPFEDRGKVALLAGSKVSCCTGFYKRECVAGFQTRMQIGRFINICGHMLFTRKRLNASYVSQAALNIQIGIADSRIAEAIDDTLLG